MKRKLLFFDIDGTLLPYHKDVPQDTREALKQVMENGHIPVICSGRPWPTLTLVKPVMELNLPGVILAAGGEVIYEGKRLCQKLLSQEVLDWTIELLDRAGCGQIFEGPEHIYYQEKWSGQVFPLWSDFIGSMEPFRVYERGKQPIQKLMIFNAPALRGTEAEAELKRFYTVLYYDFGGIGELIPRDTNKATGIQTLLDHLGMDLADTYAFGDGPNDLEMLGYAAHGVAMGNAPQEVKNAADYVTAGCEEGGIRLALEHFGLIEGNS